ncbi:hypothetical protein [Mesorhizobium sp.]|uniref:hypothetical protein n=1 Tax=Mesorhizobium sp. TaxID=1871066 RepID=UPI0025E4C81C|nr:hypothetical protein [Mesorhizobium sp.]
MTADEAIAQHRAFLAEIGEDILIRRVGVPDVTVRARVMGYQPKELIGTIAQGDVKIIAMAEALADRLPLTTNDAVVVRGKEISIKAVDDNTRRIGGTLIALEIQAGD